ncbi:hypothetical protein F8M41_020753 [Gigaspora margarita]|uniref:Uncharacterized protein n=1 Tax=Gigaspora margarita TaxID=4874 RepID=A0A8H4EJL9_GIGMA|nr:hypothetical protein F8M41_020753 [Gigaspora margarita]
MFFVEVDNKVNYSKKLQSANNILWPGTGMGARVETGQTNQVDAQGSVHESISQLASAGRKPPANTHINNAKKFTTWPALATHTQLILLTFRRTATAVPITTHACIQHKNNNKVHPGTLLSQPSKHISVKNIF